VHSSTGVGWSVVEPSSGFTINVATQISPNPVPSDWSEGFVAVSDYKIYYSSTGAYNDFTLINSIDYTTYQAWGVTRGTDEWIVKLAKIPDDGVIKSDTIFQLYVISIQDGLTLSNPSQIPYTSYSDYGLSYSSTSKLFISACKEGIIVSSDGDTWNTETTADEVYQFVNLLCSGERCVGVTPEGVLFDSANHGQGYTEITLPSVTFIESNYPRVSINTQNPSKAVFVVGSAHGLIYSSDTASFWSPSATPQESADAFQGCTEIFTVEDVLVMNCDNSVLISGAGEVWTPQVYSLSDITGLTSMCGDNDALVAYTNQKEIYVSTNIGLSWRKRAEFALYPGDDFVISNLVYLNDVFIALASDRWTNEQGEDAAVPIVITSINEEEWDVYSSSAYIFDIAYSKDEDSYYGAGKYGIYSSTNFYEWERLTSSNMECTRITSDGGNNIMALCSNFDETSVDSVVYASADNGNSWSKYTSPCQTYSPQPGDIQVLHCSGLDYVEPLGGFVLYSQDPAGIMFFSDDVANTWAPVDTPYSSRFLGTTTTGDTFVILTKTAVFSGDTFGTGPSVSSTLYTASTSSPDTQQGDLPPGYLLTEPLDISTSDIPTTLPPSFDVSSWLNDRSESAPPQYDDDNDDKDSDNLSGGAITGIVFAVLFCVIFLIVAVLGAGVIAKKRNEQRLRNEQTKLLNDENDLL